MTQYYGQSQEDAIIEAFFKKLGVGVGTFVDVGAGDGIKYSNTYLLELQGWGGLLIEPDPRSIDACRQNRRNALDTGRTRLIEAACVATPTEQPVTLYLATLPELSTLAVERDADIARIHANCHVGHSLIPHSVVAATLGDILSVSGIRQIDYLTVDTEWRNSDTLRGMNWTGYRPLLIVVEANDQEEYDTNHAILTRHDYHLGKSVSNNYFYVCETTLARNL